MRTILTAEQTNALRADLRLLSDAEAAATETALAGLRECIARLERLSDELGMTLAAAEVAPHEDTSAAGEAVA